MKIANIDGESLHIFWKTRGISMKFSAKDVAIKQGFSLSLEDSILENLEKTAREVQIDPESLSTPRETF